MKPGHCVKREYEYIRHGTLCLIAALNVVTGKANLLSGKILPWLNATRTEADFVYFIRQCCHVVDSSDTPSGVGLFQAFADQVLACSLDLAAANRTALSKSLTIVQPSRMVTQISTQLANRLTLRLDLFGQRPILHGLLFRRLQLLFQTVQTFFDQLVTVPQQLQRRFVTPRLILFRSRTAQDFTAIADVFQTMIYLKR